MSRVGSWSVVSFLLVIAVTSIALPDSWADDAANDESAIRGSLDSYVEAFNRRDAAALSSHWSETGEWINPAGERITGKDAIHKEMVAYFAASEPPRLEISDTRIRLLSPTVALEEGRARLTSEGELPNESTYIALHVKKNGQWKLDSVRETELPAPTSNFEHLRDLEWMVGTWVDQGENGHIETICQWSKNRNFLTRSFAVHFAGRLELEGTQVIGYDAANETIRSWIFDSAGGFGDSTWTKDGDRWIIKNSQTLHDGARTSSINIITYIDENTCTWESTGRELDGELMPSIPAVTVVRVDPSEHVDHTSPPLTATDTHGTE